MAEYSLKGLLFKKVELVFKTYFSVRVTGTGTQKHDKHRNAGGGSLL